jgi:hypothetical protein
MYSLTLTFTTVVGVFTLAASSIEKEHQGCIQCLLAAVIATVTDYLDCPVTASRGYTHVSCPKQGSALMLTRHASYPAPVLQLRSFPAVSRSGFSLNYRSMMKILMSDLKLPVKHPHISQ